MLNTQSKLIVQDLLSKFNFECTELNTSDNDKQCNAAPAQKDVFIVHSCQPANELRENNKLMLTNQIKLTIMEMLASGDQFSKIKNSRFITGRLKYNYTYLANIFSEVTGTTIEQYIIEQKITMIKVLILNGELNLTEISYKLNYSSISHLSRQFKKSTGMSASDFRKMHAA